MDRNIAIGVDIGGSHISCAAVDIVKGKILRETLSEREVDNQAQAHEIINTWADALNGSLAKVPKKKVKGIGFAMPGPFDYVKGISYIRGVAKYENLYGVNISRTIVSSLGSGNDFLIRFMNDASSFAVGEAWTGTSSGVYRSMAITLGTGFGSAFINNHVPIVDGPEVPRLGCIYHIPYQDTIADDYFTTRWFTGRYKNISGKELKGVKEIAALAATDRTAMALFEDFGTRLGVFLAPWLNGFRAEMLVIGGNISNAYNLFSEPLEKSLKNERCFCKVSLSTLKEDAAIIGSAYLLNDQFWNSVQHALPLM